GPGSSVPDPRSWALDPGSWVSRREARVPTAQALQSWRTAPGHRPTSQLLVRALRSRGAAGCRLTRRSVPPIAFAGERDRGNRGGAPPCRAPGVGLGTGVGPLDRSRPIGTRRTDPGLPASASERRVRMPGPIRNNGAPRPAPGRPGPADRLCPPPPPYSSRHHPARSLRRPGRTTLFRETTHALDPPPPPPAALP